MSQRPLLSSLCKSCRNLSLTTKNHRHHAQFTTTTKRRMTDDEASKLFGDTISRSTRRPAQPRSSLAAILETAQKKPSAQSQSPPNRRQQQPTPSPQSPIPRPPPSSQLQSLSEQAAVEAASRPTSAINPDEPYHINVFAHKHNIHITFTEPSRDVILSLSGGDIGLRKAQRGTFDAAYQLAAYTIRKMAEKQWRQGGSGMTTNALKTLQDVRQIEVIMRGFGPGREAFQKVLLGNEGRLIRDRVVKVTDSTRLKFGGARSPQVRRLG